MGKTFERYQFTSAFQIMADSLFIEDSSTTQKFIVQGRRKSDYSPLMLAFDFSSVHHRQCELTTSDTSDFDTWTVARNSSAFSTGDCFMGHRTLYHRRKSDRECFIGNLYSSTQNVVENCVCTQFDYECDYGYHSVGGVGSDPLHCVLDDHNSATTPILDPFTNQLYTSNGYRKLYQSTCQGGSVLESRQYLSSTHSGLSVGGQIVVAMLVVAIVVIGVFVVKMRYPHMFQRYVLQNFLIDIFRLMDHPWLVRVHSYLRLDRIRYSPLNSQFQNQGMDVLMDDY